jgi:hypothetical protein
VTFDEFCADPKLLNEPISPAWSIVYRMIEGGSIGEEELPLWREITGKSEYQPRQYDELTAVKGRRAQGTKTACKYIVWKVHTGGFERFVPAGERLHVPLILQSREVAREVKGYIDGFYERSPLLSKEVRDIFRTQVVLKNNFVIGVWTASFRAPRGVSIPLALGDEIGVWRQEGADTDTAVIRSLRPAMITFPGRRLIKLGSPWVRIGVLWDDWRQRHERDDRLVVHVPTRLGNPLLLKEELERERQADPENYERVFRTQRPSTQPAVVLITLPWLLPTSRAKRSSSIFSVVGDGNIWT